MTAKKLGMTMRPLRKRRNEYEVNKKGLKGMDDKGRGIKLEEGYYI